MSIEDYVDDEDIKRFERETGVKYIDYTQKVDTPMYDVPENHKGESIKDISTLKDVAYSVGGSIADFYKSIEAIGFNAGYRLYNITHGNGNEGPSERVLKEEGLDGTPAYESQTTAGAIAGGFTKAGLGYASGSALLGAAGLTGAGGLVTGITLKGLTKSAEGIKLGKILAPAMSGMLGDGLAFWQDKENLSNILRDNIDNKYAKQIFDYLAIDEDDTGMEKALKQSFEGLFTGLGADAVFKFIKCFKGSSAIAKKVKQLSEPIVKKTSEATDAIIDAVENVAGKIMAKKGGEEALEKVGKEIVEEAGPELEQAARMYSNEELGIKETLSEHQLKLSEEIDRLRVETPQRYDEIRSRAMAKFVDESDIDFSTMTSDDVRVFMETNNPDIEKVILAEYNEEKVVSEVLDRFNKIEEMEIAGQVTDADIEKFTMNNLTYLGEAAAATIDAASKPARAVGYLSKSKTHVDLNKVVKGICDNADTLDFKKIYKAMKGNKDIHELAAKFEVLTKSTDGSKGSVKKLMNKFTAIEQAGLMTNFNTIFRNAYTGLEMAFTGGVEDVIAAGTGRTIGFAKKMLGKGERTDFVSAKQGINFAKNFIDNSFGVLKYCFDKFVMKKEVDETLFRKFRESTDGARTYSLKSVGQTFDDSTWLGRMGNTYMKLSGVGISEGVDDFMGNVFYRTEMQNRASSYVARVAKQKKLTKAQADELYKKTLANAENITAADLKSYAMKSEEFLVARSIAKKSKEYALEQTFRGDESAITRWLSDGAKNANYLIRPFIPFVKTASSIAIDRFLRDRTVLGLLSEKSIRAITAGGKDLDRLIAKQLVGNSVMALGGYMFASGMLTADYPTNKDERAIWKANGIQPNSLRIPWGDGYKYISLDGLGPLALALKTGGKIANAIDQFKQMNDEDENTLMNAGMISVGVILSTVKDETVFRYMGDVLRAVERSDNTTLDKVKEAFGAVALNVIPRVGEGMFWDDNEAQQTADGLYEKVRRKFGLSTSDELDLFGKKVPAREKLFGPLAPFNTTEAKSDPVVNEMLRSDIFVDEPNKSMQIDGIDIDLDENQLYSVKLAMNRMGVYEKIKEVMNGSYYKMLTYKEINDNSKEARERKKTIIRRIYNTIKKKALSEVVKTNLDLREKYQEDHLNRNVLDGYVRSDVASFLNDGNIPTLR